MKKILISLISFYQKTAPYRHRRCGFTPTCSEYAREALTKYGLWKGSRKALWRIMRCHPWQKQYYDPLL